MHEEEISIFPEEQVEYSGFWRRFAAILIDGIILSIVQYMIAPMFPEKHVGEIFGMQYESESRLLQLTVMVINWLYFALMESSASQSTIGKMALGIKVTDIDGQRISFGKATGRHFGKILSTLVLLIGFIMVAWDDKRQALHDKLAGTLVIRKQS